MRPASSLAYRLLGSDGPLVVLLHGLGSRGDDWLFQVEALREGFRSLTIDLPGHGDSPPPAGWPTIADMAGQVSRIIEQTSGGAAHLVGLSLGGGVALQLAADRPARVRSLTIVNASATLGGGLRRIPESLVRIALLGAGRMQWLGAWVARGLFPSAEQFELRRAAATRIGSNSRLCYLKAVLAVLRYDLRARVQAIRMPTLVVAGEHDTTIPLRDKRWLATAIRGARLVVIRGSRHATPLDAPQAFNRELLIFLEEVG